ncbi:XdhC family protein [Paenibacillus sp. OV219]|uniref:XdhC family protein n=1 Tax=Paenibacillus sp. OV219 TaxID=1884377 RepID=UPI0008CBDD8A|nr:XdhC family protein [Paenibacillus sp. OV219]SEO30857.1 xanthine dehydrogenase accessory factor [Paenibacillus sp. OV219]
MNDRYRMLQVLKRNQGQRYAMATIIAVEGSSYRHAGAKMLIGADGSQHGAISAGCLEEDLLHHAQEVIRSREPRTLEYDLRSEDDLAWGRGAGCNGRIHVYLECCEWGGEWAEVERHLNRGESIVCARRMMRSKGTGTVQNENRLLLYAASGMVSDDDGDSLTEQMEAQFRSFMLGDDTTGIEVLSSPAIEGELLVERYRPREQLFIFGAGSDVELLARLASELDFEVCIVDPRSDRCSERHFRTADRLFNIHPDQFLLQHSIASSSYVLIMTHQFQQDQAILRQLVKAPPSYIGVLGSRSRTERLLHPEPVPDFVHAPVGLAIGAEGAEEISVSIVAELIRVRSGTQPRGGVR